MYVTQRGPKYRFWERVVLPDGTVKKVSVTMDRDTPQSRRKAQDALDRKKSKLIPVEDVTYSQLVDLYIQYQKATVKMSTWVRNEATLKRLIKDFGAKKRINDFTAGFISSRLLDKTSNPGTYNEYLSRVKGMFKWAYRNDYLNNTACVDKLLPLKEDMTDRQKVADKFLEADELKAIIAKSSEYYGLVFQFLALSGLRIGELIALDDEDITDTDIIVRKTYDSNNGVMNTPKTAAGWRYVHIQPELQTCIRNIRRLSNAHRLITGARLSYFVVSNRGSRLSYVRANANFKAVCVRVTGKRLSLHALRHTHVALMAASGIDIEAIARRCGHSDSRVTKEIYFHVTEQQRERDNAAFDAVSILA